MLTGERLFRGSTDMVVLELVRKADVAAPSQANPDVSPALDAVVRKALAREPDARYATDSEMLRDLESILYSFSPAPGSADVAIYLNRLRESEVAATESRPVEPAFVATPTPVLAAVPAAPAIPAAPRPSPPSAAPPAVVAAAAETPPPDAVPERAGSAEVFGSFSASRMESDRKNRTPLYLGMAAILLIGGILAFVLSRRSPEAAPAAAPTPAPAVAEAPASASLTPLASIPTPAAPDPKAIQQEVQRGLEARRQAALREQQKAAALAGALPVATPRRAPLEAPVANTLSAPPPPLPTAAPEPTEVAVAVEPVPRDAPVEAPPVEEPSPAPREAPAPPARVAAPPPEAETARGDLVGPGPGVVEPALLAPPRIVYPPMARQQRVAGQVVVLVLVNENGGVADARVQRGIGGRSGIDGIVLDAVRSTRFRAATKKGIPVKMWRTVVVDVKP